MREQDPVLLFALSVSRNSVVKISDLWYILVAAGAREGKFMDHQVVFYNSENHLKMRKTQLYQIDQRKGHSFLLGSQPGSS